MTALRTAAQQALEAMEAALSDDQPYIERCKQTITALRAALAQQDETVQEPEGLDWRYTARIGYVVKPYTSPPQRQPLTDEVAALTAQRDALLKVLKYLDKAFRQHGRQHWPEAVRVAAAIKAVEGTK